MSKAVWVHEGRVLARGVNSRRELAQAIRDIGGYSAMGALRIDVQSSPREIEDALGDVEAFTIPVSHYRLEEWDGSRMYRCDIGDRPGSGYVKVLIASPSVSSEGGK